MEPSVFTVVIYIDNLAILSCCLGQIFSEVVCSTWKSDQLQSLLMIISVANT